MSAKQDSSPVEEDHDDLLLEQAAAAWAEQTTTETGEESTWKNPNHHRPKKSPRTREAPPSTTTKATTKTTTEQPKIYSVHITQLDYDCKEWELRQFLQSFVTDICSIRLVYDRNSTTTSHNGPQQRTFRGVAFCDVASEESYRILLNKVHHQPFQSSSKINVRPTKTKQELQKIVQERNMKIRKQIHDSLKEKRRNNKTNSGASSRNKKNDQNNNSKKKKYHGRSVQKVVPKKK